MSSTVEARAPANIPNRNERLEREASRVRPAVVSIEGVTRAFDDTVVLDDISLDVAPGQVFGLIGPSGCGKTTLVKMLVGLTLPTEGRILVQGVEPANFTTSDRRSIGYTPQGFVLYPTLTVLENAKFVAGLYGLGFFARRRRIRDVLTFLEIWDVRRRLASKISGGMQRRLSLACALFHRPSIIFVDEPTSGLDPVLRSKVWEHLYQLRDQGTTVFLTTQYIDEAELCDRVAILNKGSIVAEGTPGELRQTAFGGEALDISADGFTREDIVALWNLECVESVQWNGRDELRVFVDDAASAIPKISKALADRGRQAATVSPYVPTFDEVFIEMLRRK